MTIIRSGRNKIRDLVYDDIDKGQLGTGGTSSSENDTALETPDATTLLNLLSKVKSDKQIKWTYQLNSTGGTTTTYKEFELQESATPTHYDRIVFTGVSFTNGGTEDFIVSKKYFFKRV